MTPLDHLCQERDKQKQQQKLRRQRIFVDNKYIYVCNLKTDSVPASEFGANITSSITEEGGMGVERGGWGVLFSRH